MSTYTEDHLVEQSAIQLMRDELGWEVVNAYGDWSSGKSQESRKMLFTQNSIFTDCANNQKIMNKALAARSEI
jgi:hypothetical protein